MNQSIVHHDLLLQDDGRGISDILWTCVVTIFLCCWTSLCVNLPAPGDRQLNRFREKLNICVFSIAGPDFLMLISISEWESARRSVQKFKSITSPGEPWTMKHAFYADMGGFHLETPDEGTFPVDTNQLHYLISKGYVDYPTQLDVDIEDRNKRDGLARAVTVIQALVFLVKTFARISKHIAVTSLEVTTIAFVFATLITSYFWREKPQDIYRPIYLKSHATLSEILKSAGREVSDNYTYTPLDFVNTSENFIQILWHVSRYIPRFVSGEKLFKAVLEHPVKRLQSDSLKPFSLLTEISAGILATAYSAIFFISWNSAFPTPIEHLLWRIASIIMITLPGIYGWVILIVDFGIVRKQRSSGSWILELEGLAKALTHRMNPKSWSSKPNGYGQKPPKTDAAGFDRATKLLMGVLIVGETYCVLYLFARAYVLMEDFVELRRLPTSAYTTLTWTHYLPHT